MPTATPPVLPEVATRDVSRQYGIAVSTLTGRLRTKSVNKARKALVKTLYDDCGLSFPEIGRRLGGRGHATIIYLYRGA